MKSIMLYIPGALFLLVILLRVVLPWIKTSAWGRMLQKAQYERYNKNYKKSDFILEEAVKKHPKIPAVYLEYFLNHSDKTHLDNKFNILKKGYSLTGDKVLAFFIGSSYLENDYMKEAEKYLKLPGSIEYMIKKRIPLLVQLYYEKKDYAHAEHEYISFYKKVYSNVHNKKELFEIQSPQELILYVLIWKSLKKEWKKIMDIIPKKSFHTDMSWTDYLNLLKERYNALEPAVTGVNGDAAAFNNRRKLYFEERISIIKAYLKTK